MLKKATVTSKGQVTIPRDIRRLLGLRGGDKLIFEAEAAGVSVRPVRVKSAFGKYQGIGNPQIPSGRKNISKWLRGFRSE